MTKTNYITKDREVRLWSGKPEYDINAECWCSPAGAQWYEMQSVKMSETAAVLMFPSVNLRLAQIEPQKVKTVS
jgi:hypothetical protein